MHRERLSVYRTLPGENVSIHTADCELHFVSVTDTLKNDTVEQRSALLPLSKKVLGSIPGLSD